MAVNEKTLRAWRGKILDFSDACCVIRRPDRTVGAPRWSKLQKTWLKAMGAVNRDGSPRWPRVGLQVCKRSGKTLVAAVRLLHASLSPESESFTLSNSRESSESLAFDTAAKMVRDGPLSEIAEVQTGRIIFRALGTTIRALPCSPKTVAGLGVSNGVALSDELWRAGPEGEEAWALLSAQAESGQTVMVSQASGVDSPVYRMWQLAESGQDPDLWFHRTDPEWLRNGSKEGRPRWRSPNPYLTPQWLEAQRLGLGDAVFSSYFLNFWGSVENLLLRPEDVEAAFEEWAMPRTRAELDILLRERFGVTREQVTWGWGLDRAQPYREGAGDSTAACLAGKIGAGDHAGHYIVPRVWVSSTSTEPEILGWVAEGLALCGVYPQARLEAFQSADLLQRIPLSVLVAPTGPRRVVLYGRLSAVFGTRTVHAPQDADLLRRELAAMQVDTSAALARFDHPRGGHSDTVDALCLALEPLGGLAETGEITVFSSSDSDRLAPQTITEHLQNVTGGAPGGVTASEVRFPDAADTPVDEDGEPVGMHTVRHGQLYGHEDIPSTEEALAIGRTLGPDGEQVAT